jgi:hypothetical protein
MKVVKVVEGKVVAVSQSSERPTDALWIVVPDSAVFAIGDIFEAKEKENADETPETTGVCNEGITESTEAENIDTGSEQAGNEENEQTETPETIGDNTESAPDIK